MFKVQYPPDVNIDNDYMHRWYKIRRNKIMNIYVHKLMRSDERILHDHPWWSFSILLKGELIEHSFNGKRCIPRWWPIIRSGKFAHRLEVVKGPVWTLFITAPYIRQWGFHTPEGWVDADTYRTR